MNDIEKLRRHLSKSIPVTIENLDGESDVFNLKPLTVEQQAIMMEISKGFQSRDEIEVEGKKVPDVTKEDMKEMELLLIDIVKGSIEGLDDELAKDFVNTNFDQLSNKLVDLIPQSQGNKDVSSLKQAKKRIENGQQTETTKTTE